jgi:hypothetical protein
MATIQMTKAAVAGRPVASAPELPMGYAGSILLALVPPLWRRVMDRRIGRLAASPHWAGVIE